jgi:hypothetical protein
MMSELHATENALEHPAGGFRGDPIVPGAPDSP